MDVNGKLIVVTGAGQGLGAAICRSLSKAGASLALIDINQEGLEETQKSLPNQSSKHVLDITNESDVEQVFNTIAQRWGRIDGLINNAGVLNDGLLVKVKDKQLSKMSLEQFNQVIDVNLTGSFLCGREATVNMLATGSEGVIINISSVSRAGNIGQSNYSASKAAVATLAVCWGKELARYGIRAAAIAPGVIKTAMTDKMKPEAKARLNAAVPLGRLGDSEEVAKAVMFILSNDYFNARVLELDGGLTM